MTLLLEIQDNDYIYMFEGNVILGDSLTRLDERCFGLLFEGNVILGDSLTL